MSLNITKDILFDRYGDIRFNYGDIILIDDIGDIFYQNVIHRLITNFNDLKTAPNSGAALSSFIGKPITPELEERVKTRIIFSLTLDSFLDTNEIEVITLSQNDKIFVRLNIFVNQSLGFNSNVKERLTINAVFNPSNGLLYATI